MDNFKEVYLNSEHIFTGKVLNVHVDTVRLPNGNEATREVVDHPGAIAVVPVLDDGRIVLVRQYRYPIQSMTLEIPAGKLDIGEDPDHCATRELKEETGYTASDIRKVLSINTAPGFSNEVIHLYVARGLKFMEASPDEDEFIDTEIYRFDQIKSMITSGEITDAKTLVGLFLSGL